MAEEKYVQVRNLAGHPVVYNIYEDHIRRVFGPTETKSIAYSELKKLYQQTGGAVLLKDFLCVEDKVAAAEFGVSKDSIDHEYQWKTEDVQKLLREGTLDELEDALDFAPEGIIDQIVYTAVETRVPDIRKRKIIFDHTGRDISAMIQNQIDVENALGKTEEPTQTGRRVSSDAEDTTEKTGRRAE